MNMERTMKYAIAFAASVRAKIAARMAEAKRKLAEAREKELRPPEAIRMVYHSKYQPHSGQREALRAYRRAQGGPGIELVGVRNPTWQPRA